MMVRIALLALMALALDLGWLLAPEPRAAPAWPRAVTVGRCKLTLHEPRRDPVAEDAGSHTLRIAFSCTPSDAGTQHAREPSSRTIRGTAVVIGDPQADSGAYALSGARTGAIAFPTVLDPDSGDMHECRAAIESALSGSALMDSDPRLCPPGSCETLLAGPDSRVYALRSGTWWREENDGSWSAIAEQGSASARRDARLAPLERTMAERQLRDGR